MRKLQNISRIDVVRWFEKAIESRSSGEFVTRLIDALDIRDISDGDCSAESVLIGVMREISDDMSHEARVKRRKAYERFYKKKYGRSLTNDTD